MINAGVYMLSSYEVITGLKIRPYLKNGRTNYLFWVMRRILDIKCVDNWNIVIAVCRNKLHVAIWACIKYSIVGINIHPWFTALCGREVRFRGCWNAPEKITRSKQVRLWWQFVCVFFLVFLPEVHTKLQLISLIFSFKTFWSRSSSGIYVSLINIHC